MLSRFIAKRSHLRLLTLISSQSQISNHRHYYCPSSSLHHPVVPNPSLFKSLLPRHFSSNRGSNNNNNDGNSKNQSGIWNLSSENDQNIESVFGSDDTRGSLEGIGEVASVSEEKDWVIESEGKDYDIFKEVEEVGKGGTGTIGGAIDTSGNTWEGYEDWNLTPGNEDIVFDFEKGGEEQLEMRGRGAGDEIVESQKREEEERFRIEKKKKEEEEERLEVEEKELSAVLKGKHFSL